MALFDQQQQQEEQRNQIQPYGVCVGSRRPKRPEQDAPMVNPLNGPQNEQRGPEVLYQQNALIQQVVHFESDPELRHLVQGKDASIEQIIQEIVHINSTTAHVSKLLTEGFAGVRGDAQIQSRFGQSNGLIADQIAGNFSRNYASFTFRDGTAEGTMPQGRIGDN